MKVVFPRIILLPLAGALALFIGACGNDDSNVTGAGRVPTATPMASASATATTGSPTATPAGTSAPGDQVFVRGAIQSINGAFYQVAGNTVQTDSSTTFNNADGSPTTAAAFKVGDRVRVVGFTNADGTVFARKFSFDTP